MDVVRGVAIRQPEITRLAAGETTIEVKTWRTDYRGDLLLVSALTPWIEPAGYAIAYGRLVDCRRMTRADEAGAGKKFYGNAQAWVFSDVQPIRIFPVKIGRNVFDVEVPSFGIQPTKKVPFAPSREWSKGTRAALSGKAGVKTEPKRATSLRQGQLLDILVADADQLFVRGLRRAVLGDHRVRVVGSCSAALAAIKVRLPDLVICDDQLGSESSVPLLEMLAMNFPKVRRVLYSSSRPDVWARTIDSALVHAAVGRPATREQLLAAITAA